jgi:hypothetical protein
VVLSFSFMCSTVRYVLQSTDYLDGTKIEMGMQNKILISIDKTVTLRFGPKEYHSFERIVSEMRSRSSFRIHVTDALVKYKT